MFLVSMINGPLQQVLDFAEVQSAKFRPARADDQRFHAFRHGIRRFAVIHRAVQFELGIGIATGS